MLPIYREILKYCMYIFQIFTDKISEPGVEGEEHLGSPQLPHPRRHGRQVQPEHHLSPDILAMLSEDTGYRGDEEFSD